MKRSHLFGIGVLGVLGLAAWTHSALSQPADRGLLQGRTFMPYVQIAGHDSARKEPGYELITSEGVWRALWGEHRGTAGKEWSVLTRHEVPAIDFTQCVVVACFGGESTNSDAKVVEQVIETDDALHIRYITASFQTAGPDGGAIKTSPYGFWVLPRIAKPIIIETAKPRLKSEPVTWHETHRFPAPAEVP
jgi:hypothetical protein